MNTGDQRQWYGQLSLLQVDDLEQIFAEVRVGLKWFIPDWLVWLRKQVEEHQGE